VEKHRLAGIREIPHLPPIERQMALSGLRVDQKAGLPAESGFGLRDGETEFRTTGGQAAKRAATASQSTIFQKAAMYSGRRLW
jgi:hypothetical protein